MKKFHNKSLIIIGFVVIISLVISTIKFKENKLTSSNDKSQEIKELKEQVKNLNDEIDELKSSLRSLRYEKDDLEDDIYYIKNRLDDLEDDSHYHYY